MRHKRIIFLSSKGGHLNELLQLSPLFDKYESYLITENKGSVENLKRKINIPILFLYSAYRGGKISFIIKNICNIFYSIHYLLKINPQIIITTGANVAVPICFIGKMFGKKIIFIESYAMVKSQTLSGRIIYPIADLFFVQCETMLNLYPKAKFIGGVY